MPQGAILAPFLYWSLLYFVTYTIHGDTLTSQVFSTPGRVIRQTRAHVSDAAGWQFFHFLI